MWVHRTWSFPSLPSASEGVGLSFTNKLVSLSQPVFEKPELLIQSAVRMGLGEAGARLLLWKAWNWNFTLYISSHCGHRDLSKWEPGTLF